MSRKWRLLLATSYWVFSATVFEVGLFDPNNEGGIPSLIVTFPWSVLLLAVIAVLDNVQFLRSTMQLLGTTPGNFFIFPFLCGGLNAMLIYLITGLESTRRTHDEKVKVDVPGDRPLE
jgi:hypothetical protein